MTATTRKSKTAAKPGRTKPKGVAATEKKASRVRKAASVETISHVETLTTAAIVANDDVMMRTFEITEVEPVDAMMPGSAGMSDDRILLPARMELASIDEAHQLLQSKYPPLSDKYILDGGILSVIDSAGIQMLISFIRSTTARGCKVEWDNYSVQVYQLASELGVASQLGD